MDEELKNYLDRQFSGVKAEFIAVRGEIKAESSEVRAEIKAESTEVRAEIEATETKLLTEFWKWGRTSDQRIRRVEHSDATTAERMTNLEERVFTLERKAAGSPQ